MRRAVLACFLWQSYGDAVDHVVVMFSKLMTKMERQADDALDEQLGQHKNTIYSALGALGSTLVQQVLSVIAQHGGKKMIRDIIVGDIHPSIKPSRAVLKDLKETRQNRFQGSNGEVVRVQFDRENASTGL